MRVDSWLRASFAVGLLATAAIPGAVNASALTFLDHLIITRSPLPVSPGAPGFIGTYEGQGIFYADTFSDGLEPPSAGSFAAQIAPGSYGVFGNYGSSDESGGKLLLNSSKGALTVNAAGDARRNQQAVLLTNTDPANSVAGLKQAFHTFAIYGLFDLTLPPNPIDAYSIFLRDSGPELFSTEELTVQLRRELDNSLAIRFFRQDFVGGLITPLDSDPLVVPVGADQVELRLQRANLGSDLVSAAYRFWDNGAPVGTGAFTPMDGATDFFNTRAWGQAGFRAFEAVVPVPSTFLLLLGALGVLGFAVRWRSG